MNVRFRHVAALVPAVLLGLWSDAGAQNALTFELPPTLILPNYHRVPLGQREGLEAGAYVARTDDGIANWYNPAGLALAQRSGLNAGGNAYEWMTVGVEGKSEKTSRSAFNPSATLLAFVLGAPVIESDNWRIGFSTASPVSWRPSTLDDEFEVAVPAGNERITYEAASSFTQIVPALGVGVKMGPTFRLGGSLGGSWTSINQNQSTNDYLTASDSVGTRSRAFAAEGGVAHLLATLGMQWSAGGWNVGATLTSPGMRMFGSALVRYDATRSSPSLNGYLTFRDEKAKVDYKLPLEAAAGISRKFARGAIEADVRYHAATDEYVMLSSDGTGTGGAQLPGGPTQNYTLGFDDVVVKAASVVSVAVGGQYEFSKAWIGHVGFFTDPSPVDDGTAPVFRKADLYGLTIGASLHAEHLSGSLGFGYSFGTSEVVTQGTGIGGATATTKLNISSLSLNYAFTYAF